MRSLSLGLLASVATFAACGPPEDDGTPGDPTAGKSIYTTYCAACHQHDGTGVTPGGLRMGADYTAADGPLTQSDAELLAIINNGATGNIGTMPPWRGTLSAKKQRDVLAYIRASFVPPSNEETDQ